MKKKSQKQSRIQKQQNRGKTNKFKHKLSRFKKTITQNTFLFSFLTVLFLFILQFVFLSFISSGLGGSPEPDEHLFFSHVFIGLGLKYLYSHFPGYPWYGLYHYAIHFVSMIILLYAILNLSFTITRFIFFLVYFAVIELFFLNNLQFTITAFVAGQSAVFLFLSFLNKKTIKSWLIIICCIALLIISSMVRPQSFRLITIVSSPIMAIFFFENVKNSNIVLKYVLFYSLVFISTFYLEIYNKSYFNNDPRYKDFVLFNELKSRFIDWNYITYNDDTKRIFDKVGWSKNDFFMFSSWFFADKELFSIEKIREIADNFPKYNTNISIGYVAGTFIKKLYLMILPIIVSIFFIIYVPLNKQNILAIAASFLLVGTIMLYLIVFLKLPLRVYHPMFSYLAILCLYLTSNNKLTIATKNKFIKTLLCSMTFIVVLISIYKISNISKYNIEKNQRFREDLIKLRPTKDQLYVVWGASLPYTSILPFESYDYLQNFKYISLGSRLRTPIAEKRMREYGVKDIYRDLYSKDNIFLIINNLRYAYLYSQYVLEHYGIKVQFKTRYKGNKFMALRIISENQVDYQEDAIVKKVHMPRNY